MSSIGNLHTTLSTSAEINKFESSVAKTSTDKLTKIFTDALRNASTEDKGIILTNMKIAIEVKEKQASQKSNNIFKNLFKTRSESQNDHQQLETLKGKYNEHLLKHTAQKQENSQTVQANKPAVQAYKNELNKDENADLKANLNFYFPGDQLDVQLGKMAENNLSWSDIKSEILDLCEAQQSYKTTKNGIARLFSPQNTVNTHGHNVSTTPPHHASKSTAAFQQNGHVQNNNIIYNQLQSMTVSSPTIDNENIVSADIEFDQAYIDIEDHPKLQKVKADFNGLCELICNKVLHDDLLGKVDSNFYNDITPQTLEKTSILKSHLLNVHSTFQKMGAFFCGIYPNNIFSRSEQSKIVNKGSVNQEILSKGLDSIEPGQTLKLQVFKKTLTSFSGHATLIKKIGNDEFIFFDPNKGEFRKQTKAQIAQHINNQLSDFKGTDIYLTPATTYKQLLVDKKIWDASTLASIKNNIAATAA